MKYYLIVGEASGDLHASHLMAALKEEDPSAEFRFFGGDLMAAVGGTMVKHYKELAYMGFIPVLLHLRTIFANMKRCKEDIRSWNPDTVILVDYPGFNLNIAKFVLIPGFPYTIISRQRFGLGKSIALRILNGMLTSFFQSFLLRLIFLKKSISILYTMWVILL